MSASLSEVLLKVATAFAVDGGASVRAALVGVLREAAQASPKMAARMMVAGAIPRLDEMSMTSSLPASSFRISTWQRLPAGCSLETSPTQLSGGAG